MKRGRRKSHLKGTREGKINWKRVEQTGTGMAAKSADRQQGGFREDNGKNVKGDINNLCQIKQFCVESKVEDGGRMKQKMNQKSWKLVDGA